MSHDRADADRDGPTLSAAGASVRASPARSAGWIAALLLALAGAALRLHDVADLSVNSDEIYTIWETRSAAKATEAVGVGTAWLQRLDLLLIPDPPPLEGPAKGASRATWEFRTRYWKNLRDHLAPGEIWRLRWGYRTNFLVLLANEAAFAMLGDRPIAYRLSSLVAGLLALLVLPLLARRWLGDRGAFVLLAVIALSPNAIEFSRFARYYAPSLLFGGLAALAAARFATTRRRRDEAIALLACAGAVASHMTGALIAGLIVLWIALALRGTLSRWLVVGAGLAIAAAYLGPLGRVFSVIRDGIRPDFTYRWWQLAGSLIYNFGPGLVILAALAPLVVAGERRRQVVGLAAVALAAVATLFCVNHWKDVGTRYFGAIEGVALVLAAAAADALLRAERLARLARGVAWCGLFAQLPLVISNQADGQRYPYRELVARLKDQLGPHDRVIADWGGIIEYYFDVDANQSRKVVNLPANLVHLEQQLLEPARDPETKRAILVLQRQRGNYAFGGLQQRLREWLEAHATPLFTLGTKRLDSLLSPLKVGYWFELSVFSVDRDALREAIAKEPR